MLCKPPNSPCAVFLQPVPPVTEVRRGLEDPLGSDGSLINHVNRWHLPI